eukprot:TRINITY_DN1309_c4_g1_i1.p1 TRINITY_DN1309_c4_g1~~TRINITY_DN1309_c4_g1_i1.p1  ORF type:complete len:254 (-),score=76.69 TRINITY_DN1309_c4_g1_i1:206-967(-)
MSNAEKKERIRMSRALTSILRHNALKERLSIDDRGFIKVDDILKHHRFKKLDVETLRDIVESCSKQRFYIEVRNDGEYIRANQGHSMKHIQVDLEEITIEDDVPLCVHGTYYRAWEFIKKRGLSRMNRIHIHLATGLKDDNTVISGMRQSCQLFIYIDIKKAIEDGYRFYRSMNNVILSPGNNKGYIPVRYFSKVVDAYSKEEIDFDLFETDDDDNNKIEINDNENNNNNNDDNNSKYNNKNNSYNAKKQERK